MKTVHLIVGTRPEAIKMSPVYKALVQKSDFKVRLISTGQHKELLEQALSPFGLRPFHDLKVMKKGQTLSGLTAEILVGLERLFKIEKPDLILAHGDTSTCYTSALSAFYHSIPFLHVEAGLRTFSLNSPFPEEFNRQCVSRMAIHHFAPCSSAKSNLESEGVSENNITVTGSTIYDAIEMIHLNQLENSYEFPSGKKVLFTLHRREGGSDSLSNIMCAIKEAAVNHPEATFISPVHPNPSVQSSAKAIFSDCKNVKLLPPLGYPEFLSLLASASLVLTDSGGVQEEAAYLGKNVLVLRELSERNDGCELGTTRIIGIEKNKIVSNINSGLAMPPIVSKTVKKGPSPSELIADTIEQRYLA